MTQPSNATKSTNPSGSLASPQAHQSTPDMGSISDDSSVKAQMADLAKAYGSLRGNSDQTLEQLKQMKSLASTLLAVAKTAEQKAGEQEKSAVQALIDLRAEYEKQGQVITQQTTKKSTAESGISAGESSLTRISSEISALESKPKKTPEEVAKLAQLRQEKISVEQKLQQDKSALREANDSIGTATTAQSKARTAATTALSNYQSATTARGKANKDIGQYESSLQHIDQQISQAESKKSGAFGIGEGPDASKNGKKTIEESKPAGSTGSSGKPGIGNGSSLLQAARALLKAVLRVTMNATNANPIVQIAKNLTIKGITEQANAYLEAALVDSTVQGTPDGQKIILTKAQSSTLHGEAVTSIAFWNEVLNQNKQANKDTFKSAEKA